MAVSRRSFVSSGLLLLSGCQSAPTKPSLTEIGIFSAGQGSAFLPYAQAVAQVLNAAGLKGQALESTGSIENIRKVETDVFKLGTAFMGTAYEAATGTGAWTQGQKFSKVRALFPMYETSFQLVTLRASGLTNLAALAGKRVGVGPAGGPAESFFKGLLEGLNLSITLVNGTPVGLASDLLNGKIDGLWQGASVPIPVIKSVADASEAIVFGLTDMEKAAMLKRFPFLSSSQVPANSYRGQTQALNSVTAWNFVIANQALSDADAYWITKTVLEGSKGARADNLLVNTLAINAMNNSVLPFHLGAARYYRELGIALKM